MVLMRHANGVKKSFKLAIFMSFLTVALHAHPTNLKQELMDAREGAPAHISEQASYMVWHQNRFITHKPGSNGWVCRVLLDSKGRFEPSCLNGPAMQSVCPVYEYQTQALASSIAIERIYQEIER